jgi:hypothetical protein
MADNGSGFTTADATAMLAAIETLIPTSVEEKKPDKKNWTGINSEEDTVGTSYSYAVFDIGGAAGVQSFAGLEVALKAVEVSGKGVLADIFLIGTSTEGGKFETVGLLSK